MTCAQVQWQMSVGGLELLLAKGKGYGYGT